MSEKHYPKPKVKRRQAAAVDFLTPLSPEDCAEHLEAGRSPLPDLDKGVQVTDNRFQVELYSKPTISTNWPTTRRFNAQPDGWKNRATRWQAAVWFDGTLDPTGNGLTRVQGQVKRSPGNSDRALTVQLLLAVGWCILFMLVGHLPTRSPDTRHLAWWGFWGVMLLIAVFIILARKRSLARQSAALAGWITDRLDVRRDNP